MRMPRKVRVGHRTFPIVRWSDAAARAAEAKGQFQSDPPQIQIKNSMPITDRVETLIHEILHACWGLAPNENISEEFAISTLSPVLTQVMADNPELLAWISESLKK